MLLGLGCILASGLFFIAAKLGSGRYRVLMGLLGGCIIVVGIGVFVGGIPRPLEATTMTGQTPPGPSGPGAATTPSSRQALDVREDTPSPASGLLGKSLRVPSDVPVYGFDTNDPGEDDLQTYILTGYSQGWDAADRFAQAERGSHMAVDLAGWKVKVLSEDDTFSLPDPITHKDDVIPLCLATIINLGENVWTQCSPIMTGYSATPKPYGKFGVVDAGDADSKGNPIAYLFATKQEMCAYEYAMQFTHEKSAPIPHDAYVLRGVSEVKVRLLRSSPNFGCSDSFAVDANYVEVIEGVGKGEAGWTAAYADNQ